ncbi:MAG: winged helix-turn-helix transcriptional regulator [Erysipelotrichaceae bacterium]
MLNQYQMPCNIAQTLNMIGDKWTLLILHEIASGKQTYKELQESLAHIPTNLLSTRLKTLEEDHLIQCELYQNHPPRYAYSLSDSGKDLEDIFNAIILWGEKHVNTCHKQLVHKQCKHPISMKYYCKECNTYIESDEIECKDLKEY